MSKIAGNSIAADKWRTSTQPLLSKQVSDIADSGTYYNHTPFHALGDGKISSGYDTLAEWIVTQKTVVIDGYGGVFYNEVQNHLQDELSKRGYRVNWVVTSDHFKPESEIDALVGPFVGKQTDVWGTRASLLLKDFFSDSFFGLDVDDTCQINIAIGTGAALLNWDAAVVYMDIPKNEIQYRMRAGSVRNLGKLTSESTFSTYKRFYFVDWVVLDNHRNQLLERVAVVEDGQWSEDLNWLFKDDLTEGLRQ